MFSLACKLTKSNIEFLPIEISSKKISANNVNLLNIKIISKKIRGKNVGISTSEITSKKIRGNNVDFLTIEITSKKGRGNDVDFSISEITSKKYMEIMWKFLELWSSTYWCNTDVRSTSIQRGVSFGAGFIIKYYFRISKYCREQIEKVSYWLTSKQSMSNHVSLCQDMRFLLASYNN